MQRHREVVLFAAGQMNDPRPLVQHIYEMQVENSLYRMREGLWLSIDDDLFNLLHIESTVQLVDDPWHNQYINHYPHGPSICDPDTTPVFFPSQVYHFDYIRKFLVLGNYKEQKDEIPECAISICRPNATYICRPGDMLRKSLLSMCRMIRKYQAVTDFRIQYGNYEGLTEADTPVLSRNIRSLLFSSCDFSSSFMRNILRQLHDCVTLMRLELSEMDLCEVEEDLDQLFDYLVSIHEKGLSITKLTIFLHFYKLSEEFVTKWNEHCEGIASIDCHMKQSYFQN